MSKLTLTDGGQVFVDSVGILPGMIVATQGQVGVVLEVGRDFNAEVVHVLGVDASGTIIAWGEPQHGALADPDEALDPIHFADDVRLISTSFNVTSNAPLANDLVTLGHDVADAIIEDGNVS